MRNFKQLLIWQKGFQIAVKAFHFTASFPSPGSSFEAETQLLITEAVNYGDKEKRNELLKDIDEEQKMIMSFMRKLQPS